MLHDAINRYHDLLTGDVAADAQEHLDRCQRLHNLYFGGRPCCTVLRPRFLTLTQYRFLQSRVRLLLSAFAKAQAAAVADAEFRKQFGMNEVEERLFQFDPGFDCPYPTSRLDAFFVSESELQFTEYNTETPAGAGYNDALAAVFLGMPVMRQFMRAHEVWHVPTRHPVLHAILDAYAQWRGVHEAPRIAILDWREVPTYSEFQIFEQYFRSQGIECVIADPREVTYERGKLYANGLHVTLIYKRVLISELLERGGMEHPVVRAVLDRAVCMVNTFRCKALYKKASFAVMTDERNAHLFDDAERHAILAHLPWTRTVVERKTKWRGDVIDLIPHVLAHRDQLVLKPNDEYGGKGIVLGWTVDQRAWEQAVAVALAEPYVVQEKVNLPYEPYPSLIDGKVQVIERMQDTDPFLCHGTFMEGCLTRISTAALLNVTAGGGSTVPTFLVGKR